MTCNKKMVLTWFYVQYVDLREAKPRPIHSEVYVVDQDWCNASSLVGVNVIDAIRKRYEMIGCRAFSIEKCGKRPCSVDLCQLWDETAQEEGAKHE